MKSKEAQIKWTIVKWGLKEDMAGALEGGLTELWDIAEKQSGKNLVKDDVSGQFSLATVRKAFETFHYVGFPHNHPTWEEWVKENCQLKT